MLNLKVIRKDVGTFRVPRVRFLPPLPTHLSHLYLNEGAIYDHKSEKDELVMLLLEVLV